MRTIPHWINGQDVTPTSGNFGPVFNPALGEQHQPTGGPDDFRGEVSVKLPDAPAHSTWAQVGHPLAQVGRDHCR